MLKKLFLVLLLFIMPAAAARGVRSLGSYLTIIKWPGGMPHSTSDPARGPLTEDEVMLVQKCVDAVESGHLVRPKSEVEILTPLDLRIPVPIEVKIKSYYVNACIFNNIGSLDLRVIVSLDKNNGRLK